MPSLSSLVVLDDKNNLQAELSALNMKCTIDWREIFVWGENSRLRTLLDDISSSLHHEDVINLQFTRLEFLTNLYRTYN